MSVHLCQGDVTAAAAQVKQLMLCLPEESSCSKDSPCGKDAVDTRGNQTEGSGKLCLCCVVRRRLAAVDRWMHYTMPTIAMVHVHQMFGPGETGCFRQVVMLRSDHSR